MRAVSNESALTIPGQKLPESQRLFSRGRREADNVVIAGVDPANHAGIPALTSWDVQEPCAPWWYWEIGRV